MNDPLVKISNLSISLCKSGENVVDNFNLDIDHNRSYGLVGPSGSGKTLIGRSILRLNDERAVRYSGDIFIEGIDVLALKYRDLSKYRGSVVSMTFQNAISSLVPNDTIYDQVSRIHSISTSKPLTADQALEKVGYPRSQYRKLPTQISGGMATKASIAMVLCSGARLLIFDEPTTGLDYVSQESIVNTIDSLRHDGTSILLISHELNIINRLCDVVCVFDDSRVQELTSVNGMLLNPQSDYARTMVNSFRNITEKI